MNIENKYFNFHCRVMVFLMSCAFFFSPVHAAVLVQEDSAAIHYEKKEYGKAISDYEKILKEGKDSWKLHYNLGNAYFKENQLGEAILHYEIAKKNNPNDEDIRNNLKIADGRLIDRMEVKDNFFENEIRAGIINLFSTDGWAWLSISSLFLGLVLIFFFLTAQNSKVKKIFFWTGSALLLFFILVMIFGNVALKEKNSKNNAVIIAPVISIYNEPSSENKKNFQLHEGTRLRVLYSSSDGWTNVQLLNGNEGWVKSDEIGVY